MVRFLVVEQVHPCSNIRFDVDAAYLWLIILSVIVDIPVDSDALFDRLFESLRLSRPSFFRSAHTNRVCVHVFIRIRINTHMYINIYCDIMKK
jgi:hypothetical protein